MSSFFAFLIGLPIGWLCGWFSRALIAEATARIERYDHK